MIDAIIEVAACDYDRWYVLAHSLGSVVAFNGLQEPEQALANYLDANRWTELVAKGLAGHGRNDVLANNHASKVMETVTPRRPVWLPDGATVYRDRVLSRFRGLLTYGSPLEKFAALWPARVPVNSAEPHFPAEAEWVNAYDPIDPVSGVLRAFKPVAESGFLSVKNVGYRTDWKLLYSHLRYLTLSRKYSNTLGDAVAYWIMNNTKFSVSEDGRRWFNPYETEHRWRKASSGLQWITVTAIIAMIGAGAFYYAYVRLWRDATLPEAVTLIGKHLSSAFGGTEVHAFLNACEARESWLVSLIVFGATSCLALLFGYISQRFGRLSRPIIALSFKWLAIVSFAGGVFHALVMASCILPQALQYAALFIIACAAITLLTGAVANLFFFKRDPDDPARMMSDAGKADPPPFRPVSVGSPSPNASMPSESGLEAATDG